MDTILAAPEIGIRTATGRALDGMREAIVLRLLCAHWRVASHFSVGHQGTAPLQSPFDLHLSRCIKNNELDRFYLVEEMVDRVTVLNTKGHDLKQLLQEKLIEHKHDVGGHGEDFPEIRAW